MLEDWAHLNLKDRCYEIRHSIEPELRAKISKSTLHRFYKKEKVRYYIPNIKMSRNDVTSRRKTDRE